MRQATKNPRSLGCRGFAETLEKSLVPGPESDIIDGIGFGAENKKCTPKSTPTDRALPLFFTLGSQPDASRKCVLNVRRSANIRP